MTATLHTRTLHEPPAPHADAWPAEQSFCTHLCFALERPPLLQDSAAEPGSAGPTDLAAAERIAGSYTVSYNAASGLLALSGTLNVDGATYFVDDQLTIDRDTHFDANLSAASHGTDGCAGAERRLTAWSAGGMPEGGPALKLLAGLAVMSHLGLQRG